MNATRTYFVVEAILDNGYNHSNPFPSTLEGLTKANALALKWRVERMVHPECHKNVVGFRVLLRKERMES